MHPLSLCALSVALSASLSFSSVQAATVYCSTSYVASANDDVVVDAGSTCAGVNDSNHVYINSLTVNQGGMITFPGTLGTFGLSGWDSAVLVDYNGSGIGIVTNSGSIIGGLEAAFVANRYIPVFNNTSTGVISTATGWGGIYVNSVAQAAPNTYYGIGTLTNSGVISAPNTVNDPANSRWPGVGLYVEQASKIGTITNLGSITGASSGIFVEPSAGGPGGVIYASIDVLNNLQGAGNVNGALTYSGRLPTSYNIILGSNASTYGQLVASAVTGTMTFGIQSGTVSQSRYLGVLQGIDASNITGATTGTYTGQSYQLVLQNGSTSIWDLLFPGFSGATTPQVSVADTQAALNQNARKLRGVFNLSGVASNFANMNTYECNLFDANGVCVSVGGRYTRASSPDATSNSGVLVLGYQASPRFRIGAFVDESISDNMPSGVRVNDRLPLIGIFGVWNHNRDGAGWQIKLANAYQSQGVDITRDVIGTAEAGKGSTEITTESYVGELSYAYDYCGSTLLRPYLAIRYTNIKQDGYSETGVTAPLTYGALKDRSTSALVGIKINHSLSSRINLIASLGIEQDLAHKVDLYAASGMAGLTSENFNDNIKRTRPVASAGAYYRPVRNQRVAAEAYYQQLPFQSTGSTTAYVNYMIGF